MQNAGWIRHSDIEELAQHCRFRDCRHEKETGCAVQEAVRDGRLPEHRLLNYKKLLAEAAHAKRREETARTKQLRSVERKKNPVRKKQYKAE